MNVKLPSFFKTAQLFAVKHAPEILTGVSGACLIAAVISAAASTPKAVKLMEEMKEKTKDPKPLDYVKTAAACYIPTALLTVSSLACMIFANRKSARRNAVLAAAYTLSESTLAEYKQAVLENVGKKKTGEIDAAAAEKTTQKTPHAESAVILTGAGDQLCYDAFSGRYFKSDVEKLRRIENKLNLRLRDEMFISLNDYYYEVGLEGVKLGDDLGWNIDKGYIELRFRAILINDTPCIVVETSIAPYYGYM